MRRLGFLLAFGTLLVLAWFARRSAPAVHEGPERAGGLPAAGSDAAPDAVGDLLEARLAADPRLSAWLGGCARREAYDADTSDAVAILVAKLEGASTEPLNRARAELGALGEPALPELRRLIESHFDDPLRPALVQNGLEALAAMDQPWGRSLLRRGLGHPAETVRRAAVMGLARHASPYEYDALYDLLGRAPPELRGAVFGALITADRARLERDVLAWLDAGENQDLWPAAAALVCSSRDPATVAGLRDAGSERPLALRPFLAAPAAAAGDERALDALRAWLVDENPTLRMNAARALVCAGLHAELAPLARDGDASLRLFALEMLDAGSPPEAPALLRAALGDPVAAVRNAALAALVARADPAAEDQALEELRGSADELEAGLAALQRTWDARPELAERALAILVAEHDARTHRGSGELAALEQAIGRVPSAAAATWLCDRAAAAPLGAHGARGPLRDHRWYVLKAGSSRLSARPVLVQRWQDERDPQRRMDFVEALAFEHAPEVADFLLRALERPELHPYELLQLAQAAVRQGQTARSAPALKRMTLGVAHARVRPALNCLLWEWF